MLRRLTKRAGSLLVNVSINSITVHTNTLVIITGYGSVSPKPLKRAYLNVSEQDAEQRFLAECPNARDMSLRAIRFTDELIIGANGAISSASTMMSY